MVAELHILRCPSCGAPQALGRGSTEVCVHCAHVFAIPPAYQELRDATREAARADVAASEALRIIGRAPPRFFRLFAGFTPRVGCAALLLAPVGLAVLTVVPISLGNEERGWRERLDAPPRLETPARPCPSEAPWRPASLSTGARPCARSHTIS